MKRSALFFVYLTSTVCLCVCMCVYLCYLFSCLCLLWRASFVCVPVCVCLPACYLCLLSVCIKKMHSTPWHCVCLCLSVCCLCLLVFPCLFIHISLNLSPSVCPCLSACSLSFLVCVSECLCVSVGGSEGVSRWWRVGSPPRRHPDSVYPRHKQSGGPWVGGLDATLLTSRPQVTAHLGTC